MALYKSWDYVNENSSGAKVGTLTMNGQSFDVKDNQADTSVAFSSIRNTTNTSAASGAVRKIGKTVCCDFDVKPAEAITAGTWVTVATVPAAYRPERNITVVASTWDTNPVYVRTLFNTGGSVQMKAASNISASVEIFGSATWFVA